MNKNIPLSVLDLVPIGEGFSLSDAFAQSVNLAQNVEEFGFNRFWVAEHHNFKNIGSAATSVVLSHIGANTKTIKIGSGGIMLPNHSPLVIAEQFGTLESLYPNRVDLGLGRAPGTDFQTAKALRRDVNANGENFPAMLDELQNYFSSEDKKDIIKAVPGHGLDIPIWLLGSSTFSASLAASKGLPFAFASHFAPDAMQIAIDIYRAQFKPSKYLKEPYVMVCVNAVISESEDEAYYLATTEIQKFINMQRGVESYVSKPVEDIDKIWSEGEKRQVLRMLRESIWGTPQTFVEKANSLIKRTGANEIMINSWIHDPIKKIKSYELISKVREL